MEMLLMSSVCLGLILLRQHQISPVKRAAYVEPCYN